MIERVPENPNVLFEKYLKTASDPIAFVEKLKSEGLSLLNIIASLRISRKKLLELSRDNEHLNVRRSQTDSDYAVFFDTRNGDVLYYVGLFNILKRAGYDRASIESSLMDALPSGFIGEPESKSNAVKSFLPLTQEALDKVFGEEK